MQFPVVVYQDEDGGFIGEVVTLRGVHSCGKDLASLYENLSEAIELHLEVEAELTLPTNKNYSFHLIDIDAKTKGCYGQKTLEMA